jgi:hypothetical protein
MKENPAATFMNCLQSSPVENSPRSNSPPVNRRRSSVSIEARVETDDDALSMSLSPRSEPSVPSSPLITIAEKCITDDCNELIQEVNQRSILSAEEGEVFGSPASTSGSFISIPRSETPWTVSTTPVPVHPFNEVNDKPSVTLLSVGELGKSDEDLAALVFDEIEDEVISRPDIEPCDVTQNERCILVVHKAQANCPLCGAELPVACLRIDIKMGDVTVDCSKCPATIVMEALYNTKRVN